MNSLSSRGPLGLLTSALVLLSLMWIVQNTFTPTKEYPNTETETTAPPPLKIFLMVGQSNMQGHGYMFAKDENGNYRNGTLEWMIQTFPEYRKLKTNGNFTIRTDTWIAYNRQNIGNVRPEINQNGPLLPGYGGDPGQFDHMGPELGFGWTMADGLNQRNNNPNAQRILLLKIAWGGRSLAVDFRPPSSGGETGLYYESMIANTYKTLSRLGELFPEYHLIGRYELAGFVWHQGWNDGCSEEQSAEYEANLANLIRDIRVDLGVPKLPVSIGVSGFTGWNNPEPPRRDEVIAAQFAVANATKYPEFAGTVAAAETRDFYRDPVPSSPGDQVYHWNNNCETYWLIGQAMAKAMLGLISGSGTLNANQVTAQIY